MRNRLAQSHPLLFSGRVARNRSKKQTPIGTPRPALVP
jgi:hypothetical protein